MENDNNEHKNKFGDYVKDFEDKFRKALNEADKVARETMSNLVPAETASHLSNCKRELLLAVRSMIDRELDSPPKPSSSTASAPPPPAPPAPAPSEASNEPKAAE